MSCACYLCEAPTRDLLVFFIAARDYISFLSPPKFRSFSVFASKLNSKSRRRQNSNAIDFTSSFRFDIALHRYVMFIQIKIFDDENGTEQEKMASNTFTYMAIEMSITKNCVRERKEAVGQSHGYFLFRLFSQFKSKTTKPIHFCFYLFSFVRLFTLVRRWLS